MQRQVNEVTERQANRASRIGSWRGLSTLEYQHTQIYLRNIGTLVILSVCLSVVVLFTLGVAQSEIPTPRRFNEVAETRKQQMSESENESR